MFSIHYVIVVLMDRNSDIRLALCLNFIKYIQLRITLCVMLQLY